MDEALEEKIIPETVKGKRGCTQYHRRFVDAQSSLKETLHKRGAAQISCRCAGLEGYPREAR
jgi:hypothetical protein